MCVISVRITVQKPSGITDIPKGGGLTGPQLLEGVAGKGADFFQGGCNFHIKIN